MTEPSNTGGATITRPCLWCNASLTVNAATAEADHPEGTRTVTCDCGVTYSATIVARADNDVWEQIRRRDQCTVTRDGDELTVRHGVMLPPLI